MSELIDRLLANPAVVVVGGVVFGFWAIGEASRRVSQEEQRHEFQTKILRQILEKIELNQHEIEEIKKAFEEKGEGNGFQN